MREPETHRGEKLGNGKVQGGPQNGTGAQDSQGGSFPGW